MVVAKRIRTLRFFYNVVDGSIAVSFVSNSYCSTPLYIIYSISISKQMADIVANERLRAY